MLARLTEDKTVNYQWMLLVSILNFLVAWMFNGYGIYGQFSEDGKVPTDLDEIDGVSVHHYHFPYHSKFPWSISCYKCCPEVSNNPKEFSRFTEYGC